MIIVSWPGGVELALILSVGVTVNSDDADRWAGCVRDDDRLGQCGAGWGHSTVAK